MKPFDPRVLRLVPGIRGPLIGLVMLAALSGLAGLAQALAVAGLVVALVRGGGSVDLPLTSWVPVLEVPRASLLLVVAFSIRAVLSGATEALAASAAAEVSGAARRAWTAAYLRADDRSPAAALTLATSGATSIEPYVARYLPALVAAGVIPPVAIAAMAVLDWRTALVPILTVPLLPLFAALIGAATQEATQTRWRALTRLSGHFLDVMRGLPTLVNYGRAERQVAAIEDVSQRHRAATMGTLRLAFLSSAALELLATLAVAIVAVSVGIRLANGSVPLVVAMPLILLAPEAYWPIRRVGAEFHAAADGAQALAQVCDHLEREGRNSGEFSAQRRDDHSDDLIGAERHNGVPGRTTQGTGLIAPRIELTDLAYAYPGQDRRVIDGLDARIVGPGLVLVTGPSGAGKSTLLELIAGLRPPTTGRVDAPRAHLLTQRPFLAPGSIRENLLLGTGDHDDAALVDALQRVALSDMMSRLPDGLDTVLGDDGFGVSAGQRARLGLARALLSDAPLVLLDEPTAHLDDTARARVEQVVAELSRERLVLLVTHREPVSLHPIAHLSVASPAVMAR